MDNGHGHVGTHCAWAITFFPDYCQHILRCWVKRTHALSTRVQLRQMRPHHQPLATNTLEPHHHHRHTHHHAHMHPNFHSVSIMLTTKYMHQAFFRPPHQTCLQGANLGFLEHIPFLVTVTINNISTSPLLLPKATYGYTQKDSIAPYSCQLTTPVPS